MKKELLNPKSKAEQILNKMSEVSCKLSDYSRIYHPTAKLHALNAVEEFISHIDSEEKYIVSSKYITMKEYWQKVMEELENL